MKKLFTILLVLAGLSAFTQSKDSLDLNLTILNPDTIPEVGAKVELTFPDHTIKETVDDHGKVKFRVAQGCSFDLIVRQYDTIFPFGTIALDPNQIYDEVN